MNSFLQLGLIAGLLGIAAWLLLGTLESRARAATRLPRPGPGDAASPRTVRLETASDNLELSVFWKEQSAFFRLRAPAVQLLPLASRTIVETRGQSGAGQRFTFVQRPDCLESREAIQEPHHLDVHLSVVYGEVTRTYLAKYLELKITREPGARFSISARRAAPYLASGFLALLASYLTWHWLVE